MHTLWRVSPAGVNRVWLFVLMTWLLAAPSWAQSDLNQVFQRISQAANPNRGYRFAVVQNNQINAYATPDGRVVFYTGLLQALPDDNALAFVMAHEMSHIELGHSQKQSVAGGLLGTALSILVGGSNSGLARAGAGLAYNAMTSGYSRSMEAEADINAMAIMDRAGYDPNGAVTTLQMFERMEHNQGAQIFASHPSASNRLKDVTEWIQKNGQPLAAEQILAVPRPWPLVSQLIGTGRQLGQQIGSVPAQPGDQVAREALAQANQALAAYESQAANPAALALLKEGLTSAQTFALLSSSLADPGLVREAQVWGQQAHQAELNQTLDQAARTRQYADYMVGYLQKAGRSRGLDLGPLSRVAESARAYEAALKAQGPGGTSQVALDSLLNAGRDWERQRGALNLDPKVYGNLLRGLDNELLSLAILEGRVTPGAASLVR